MNFDYDTEPDPAFDAGLDPDPEAKVFFLDL
jgi:hypothetical protein